MVTPVGHAARPGQKWVKGGYISAALHLPISREFYR
jgi:hypothetical protein